VTFSRWFVAPAVAYQQQRENVTSGGDVLATLDVWTIGGRVDLGCVLGNWGEARVGLLKQTGSVDLAVGQPGSVPSDSFDQGFCEGSVTIDTVDSLALPHEGSIGRVVITWPVSWLGGEEQSYLSAQLDHAITWDRTTLVLGAEFDTALDDQQVLQNTFPLGGFLRLSGLGRDVINGAHVGLARAVSWVELGSRGPDRKLLGWNLGASLEAGQAWSNRSDIAFDDLRLSGSVFVAAETMFGPFFIGVGVTEPGQTALFLLFGNLFGNWDPF
jgi:NTE family protein